MNIYISPDEGMVIAPATREVDMIRQRAYNIYIYTYVCQVDNLIPSHILRTSQASSPLRI